MNSFFIIMNIVIANYPLDFFGILYAILENFVIFRIIHFILSNLVQNIFGNLLFSYITFYVILLVINKYSLRNRIETLVSYSSKFLILLSINLIQTIINLLL